MTRAERLAQKKCEAWSCWKELSKEEQDEVFDDYMEMYHLGVEEAQDQAGSECK